MDPKYGLFLLYTNGVLFQKPLEQSEYHVLNFFIDEEPVLIDELFTSSEHFDSSHLLIAQLKDKKDVYLLKNDPYSDKWTLLSRADIQAQVNQYSAILQKEDRKKKLSTNVYYQIEYVQNDVFFLKRDKTLWKNLFSENPQLILDKVAEIACGQSHILARQEDGSIYGCGSNRFG